MKSKKKQEKKIKRKKQKISKEKSLDNTLKTKYLNDNESGFFKCKSYDVTHYFFIAYDPNIIEERIILLEGLETLVSKDGSIKVEVAKMDHYYNPVLGWDMYVVKNVQDHFIGTGKNAEGELRDYYIHSITYDEKPYELRCTTKLRGTMTSRGTKPIEKYFMKEYYGKIYIVILGFVHGSTPPSNALKMFNTLENGVQEASSTKRKFSIIAEISFKLEIPRYTDFGED